MPLSFAPWDEGTSAATLEPGPAAGGVDAVIATYQRYLRRPALGGEGCPFRPSCSTFTRQAFTAHGPIVGLVLALDRLIAREHALAGANYATACVDGYWRWRDEVP